MFNVIIPITILALLSNLTPCMINLYKILFAYYKVLGRDNLLKYTFVRFLLLNIIATSCYLLKDFVYGFVEKIFLIIHLIIAIIFLIGFKLMSKIKFSPIDFSPSFFNIKLPPSISLGLNIPYC